MDDLPPSAQTAGIFKYLYGLTVPKGVQLSRSEQAKKELWIRVVEVDHVEVNVPVFGVGESVIFTAKPTKGTLFPKGQLRWTIINGRGKLSSFSPYSVRYTLAGPFDVTTVRVRAYSGSEDPGIQASSVCFRVIGIRAEKKKVEKNEAVRFYIETSPRNQGQYVNKAKWSVDTSALGEVSNTGYFTPGKNKSGDFTIIVKRQLLFPIDDN